MLDLFQNNSSSPSSRIIVPNLNLGQANSTTYKTSFGTGGGLEVVHEEDDFNMHDHDNSVNQDNNSFVENT